MCKSRVALKFVPVGQESNIHVHVVQSLIIAFNYLFYAPGLPPDTEQSDLGPFVWMQAIIQKIKICLSLSRQKLGLENYHLFRLDYDLCKMPPDIFI